MNAPHRDDPIPGSLAAHLREIGMGKKSLPLFARSRRHHFIPQFVLRRFTDLGSGLLHQLDIETGEVSERGPRGAAWEPKLYRVLDEQGRENDYLEGFFALVETHAAESLGRLLESPKDLHEGDRANLSLFLALQQSRTPAGHAFQREALSAVGNLHAEIALNDPGNVRRAKRRYGAKEAKRLRDEAMEGLRGGTIRVSATKEMTLRLTLETWLESAGPIHDMSWLLLRATEGEFVIGDRVITMVDPTPPYPWSGHGWLSSSNAYATVPIGTDRCLRLNQPGGESLAVRDTAAQVERINLRSYGWADRYVYARDPETLADLHAKAQRSPETVERKRPSPHVLMERADPDDSTIGSEHPTGYPRGLWAPDDDGEDQWFSYELVYFEGEGDQ